MLQVRMISSKSLAAERKRSESSSSKLVGGRSIGLLDGTKPGNKTAFRNKATWSECVSYKLDENGNKIEAHIFRPRKPNRRKLSEADKVEALDRIMEAQQHTEKMREILGVVIAD